MLFLSIDFGTSAVKMSLVDDTLRTLCRSKSEYQYLILPGEKNELRESDLMGAFFAAADQLDPSLRRQVDIICYDTFSPSLVLMDRDGNLTYPNIITHMDRRSRDQSKFIDKQFGRTEYMNISGIYPFPGGCSAMTLIWFAQNMPDILARTCRIGHLPTLLHKKLTGEWTVDLVNASMLGVYETTTQGSWSKTLLEAFSLRPDLFGEIYHPGVIRGTLSQNIARQLGVPAGIPVCVGTNDVAAAQMGAKNSRPGDIMNPTGSSEIISVLTDVPKPDPNYYLRNAALPGLWQIFSITCGGFGVDWFYRQFCQDMSREAFYQFEAQAIRDCIQAGTGGVTFEPYLAGDRQSLDIKTGSWHGLTLASTRGQMLAAYLNAIQDVICQTIRRAGTTVRLNTNIKISGGMATGDYLALKKHVFPEFSFEIVDDCPLLGNVELAKRYL